VEDIATSLGLPAKAECQRYNVQIGFTDDPQAMLDSVKRLKPSPLGDRTSDTRDVKTVTLPIQAWYVTNGELYAESAARDLKVRVLDQAPSTGGTPTPPGFGGGVSNNMPSALPPGAGNFNPSNNAPPPGSAFPSGGAQTWSGGRL